MSFIRILIIMLFAYSLQAQVVEHHDHTGVTNLKLDFQSLKFKNSKKKDEGERYGIELDHQSGKHHYQLYIEKTLTQTTKVMPKDLEVEKITLKYQHSLSKKEKLSLSFITINDNLMKQTDDGKIYGIGYKKGAYGVSGYLSDYENFNVYQADVMIVKKRRFENFDLMAVIIGKYIYLKDKNSNSFSASAKKRYLSRGIKLHIHYKDYHIGVGTYIGKRIFAVMNNGLKVQHHSMEFKNSYMLNLGREFEKFSLYIRYANHRAKEVPVNNDRVKVENIALEFSWKF